MEDTRIGRFFAIDPLTAKYPHNSPYAFSENRVIDRNELEGLETGAPFWMQYSPAGKSVGMTSESFRRQNTCKSILPIVLTATAVIDIYVTKGWLTRSIIGGSLLESINETERGYDARRKGNEVEAQRRFNNAGESSKIVVYGLLAEGASFTIGKIAKSIKGVKLVQSNDVNKVFTDNDLEAPYKPNVTLGEVKLSNNVNVVRLSGPNNVKGDWFTTMEEVKGLSPAQLKDKFSLKYEPTQITEATINAKSNVRVGEAAEVENFKTKGGGFQIEVLDGNVTYGKSTILKK